MKKFTLLLFFFSIVTPFFIVSCNSGTTGTKPEQTAIPAGEISVEQFESKLSTTTQPQLIDVRTPDEFSGGHLANAININWNGNDFSSLIQQLDKAKPTFVYCLAGSRSHEAAVEMRKSGFTEVYEMQGGIREWKKLGKPTVTTETNTPKSMSMSDYEHQISSDKLVLVDFNAPWCGPCKRMAPFLEEISKEQKDYLNLIKINSDDNTELATSMKIENLPTLILYKKGKEVWKHVGYIDKIELMVAIENAKH